MLNFLPSFGKRKKGRKHSTNRNQRLKSLMGKSLRLEPLEARQMLSVAPVILDNADAQHYQEMGELGRLARMPIPTGRISATTRWGMARAAASFTFDTLTPGKNFQLFATWTAEGNRASNAPFSVLDGNNTLATVRINQQFPPVDLTCEGHGWQSLGVYHTDSGGLTVRLSDDANAYVIADAVAAIEVPPVTVAPTIIDNADAGFQEQGTDWRGWNDTSAIGGGIRYHAPGVGENKATWTFEALDPTKTYQAFGRWSANSNHASNAPFTVYDGTTNLGSVRVNQQFAPDDVTLEGWAWENLGTYCPTSGKLVVSLSDDADYYVIGDAVRLVEVSAETTPPSVIDNAEAGYAEGGNNWLSWSEAGAYSGSFRYHAVGTGQNSAVWTFEDLDAAKHYHVYSTWSAQPNRATNSPFTIFDNTASLATVRVNQQFAPDDTTLDGQGWESLGVYQFDSGKLVVKLTDDANSGYVVADAVRIVEVPPDVPTPGLIDEGDIAYAEQGSNWLSWSENGAFQGDFRYHAAVVVRRIVRTEARWYRTPQNTQKKERKTSIVRQSATRWT